ncbi:MAG: ribonuclease HI [Candidatus Ancillula sp.]|jgi:ribonuclease HI|nr:ribonuclease HI [Candidatus Ancillula sp.]
MEKVRVSTDGSCLSENNSGDGPIGWAVVEHTGELTRSGGAHFGTNQIAELAAVLVALRTYKIGGGRARKHLVIESDSNYAIKAATEWLPNWKANGWRNSAKKPVANLELIQAIDAEILERQAAGGSVELVWVKGHNGNLFNEQADVEAREQAERFKQSGDTALDLMPKEAVTAIERRHLAPVQRT